MQFDVFLNHFQRVQKHGNYFSCQCPAHDDQKNSLSVSLDTDKILVKCHAGCNTADVLKAAGLKMSDLFLNSQNRTTPGAGRPEITAVYDYQDADGKLLFQCVRYVPKDFRQRRPDGKGGFIWNLDGITPVLYHLAKVIHAVKTGDRIIITEGEKDVDNLQKWGYTATTSPMGAGKWRPSYSVTLKGAYEIVLIAHKDSPGHKHIEIAASDLYGKVDSLKLFEMPDVPDHKIKDFTNWVEAGGTKEEFEKLLDNAPLYSIKTPVDLSEPKQKHFPLTDMGNAERLVNKYGEVIRYIAERDRWLVWNGKYWQLDNVVSTSLMVMAKAVVRDIPKEANRIMTTDEFNDILAWAKSSESEKSLNSMVSLARYEPGITVSATEFDRDLFLFNVQNGTIDLRTGQLTAHDKKDLITRISPAAYNPVAHSEIWKSFLRRIFEDDAELISYLQKIIGYSATGDTSTDIVPFCYGTGANGKSTFLNTIAYLLSDYALTINAEALMVHKTIGNDSTNEELANVNGKRAVFSREIQKNRRLN
jgi:putative DNA primase/helicase